MIFKLLGACLLTVSGVGTALALNRRASLGLKQTEGFVALIRIIRAEVDCFALPISQILGRCDPSVLGACGLEDGEAPSSPEELLQRCTVYDKESVSLMEGFFEEFGKHYRREQVSSCTYYLERMEQRRASLAASLPLQKKKNAVLCVCFALALALLMI